MKKNRWNVPWGRDCFRKLWLMSKMLMVLMFSISMNVSATLYSQNKAVTLCMKGATLEEVIQALKFQTDYGFFYDAGSEEIKQAKGININVADMLLEDVLQQVLKETNLTYSIVNEVVIINAKNKVAPQNQISKEYVLTGQIVDAKNAPLPGVTVRLENTNLGTATDVNGLFTFRLPIKQGRLICSFVGFEKKEVAFHLPCDTLKIVLEESFAKLDEVTVVAYGERKKRELVGSISSVKASDIKEVPSASLENLLQGRMAGVEINTQSGAPGGGGSVVAIRGYNSLFIGDGRDYGEPLYVIDGVPVYSFTSPITGTNALAEIDPSTIESVEVLKDAASAAIYGSRAGNGVILITTKKGKAGKAQFQGNVSYSYSILPETPEQTGGRLERTFNFLKYANEREAAYDWRTGTVFSDSYEDAYVKYKTTYDRWWKYAIEADHSSANRLLQDSLNPFYNNSTDWFRYAFRAGKIINANIQASGGAPSINYLIGAGYYKEEGIMYGSDFSRVNLLANLSAMPAPKLKVDSRMYLAYTDRSRGAGTSGGMTGSKIEKLTVDPKTMSSLLPAGGLDADELLEELNSAVEKNESYRLRASLMLQYEIIKNLKLSTMGSIDFNQGMRNSFRPSTLDATHGLNESIGEVDRNLRVLNENLLSYKLSLKEAHNFDVLFGLSYQADRYNYNQSVGKGGASDKIEYIVDPNLHVKYINGEPIYLKNASTNFTEKIMVSYFGRLAYNYKYRYLLEATCRRDGCSSFGTNVRWCTFPSVAVGWSFSEESFFDWASWLNLGKIRVSWGRSGKEFSEPYLAHGLMVPGSLFLGSQAMQANPEGGMINRNLTWEESDQYDIGLDLDMFNYRLKLKLDYYYKLTKGLLYHVDLPGDYNFHTMQWQNAMKVSNEGLELEAEVDIFRESAVSWRMKFNISRNWNLFRKSHTGKDVDNYVIGRSLNGIWVFQDEGFYDNKEEVPYHYDMDGFQKLLNGGGNMTSLYNTGMRRIEDINKDGKIDAQDLVYKGSALPLAYGGWVNEVKWKGFDVNILFAYSLGRKIYRTYNHTSLGGEQGLPLYEDLSNVAFWEKEGDVADYERPAMYHAACQQFSGAFASNLENVNYIKLKQLTIGYSVPQAWLKKIRLSGVRVFFTGENLFTLTNYSGTDPEVVSIYDGKDNFSSYPIARKMSLGLTVNF